MKLLWIAAAIAVSALILTGLIVGYVRPGPITGAVLPIGLTLWWLMYKISAGDAP